jgi:hypothetical protein
VTERSRLKRKIIFRIFFSKEDGAASTDGGMRGALLLLLLAACGTSASRAPVSSDAPATTIQFDLTTTVAPLEERYVCELVTMPKTPEEIFVSGGRYTTTPGTHHFLLFRTGGVDPALPLGRPVDCFEGQGLMRFERGFVSGGQLREESADFPEGAALPFAPGEVLLLQAHVLNGGAGPLETRVHAELRTARSARVRVGTFRFYDPFIFVPARGTATARMRCPIRRAVTLVSAGSHMHRRGVGYRAYLDPPGDPPAATPFFTTNDWQHPPYFRGPLPVPAGAHVRFECDYVSQDSADVVQGLSADANEMCMFSAFYFPQGDTAEDECAGMDMHGAGDRSCAQTLSCVALCPPAERPRFGDGRAEVGACFQRCIAESCANATGALFPELSCADRACHDECASYGATCTACVTAHCKSELDACQALACESRP